MSSHGWGDWNDGQSQDRNVLSAERIPYIFRRPMSLPCRPETLSQLHQAVDASADETDMMRILCCDPGVLCRFIRNFATFNPRLGTKSLELEQAIALTERHHWLAFISTIVLSAEFERPLPSRFDPSQMAKFCRYVGYVCLEFAAEILVGYTPFHAAALGALHQLPTLVTANASPDTFDFIADHAAANAMSFEQAFAALYNMSLEGFGEWIGRAWRFDESSLSAWHTTTGDDDLSMAGTLIRLVGWTSYERGFSWEPWHVNAQLKSADLAFYEKYRSTLDPIIDGYREQGRSAA